MDVGPRPVDTETLIARHEQGCCRARACLRPRRLERHRLSALSACGRIRPAQDGANRGWPPLSATLRGSRTIGVEPAGDLAEAAAVRVLALDARHEVRRDGPLATHGPRCPARNARLLGSLGNVALELRDRNQPSAPLGQNRRDHGDDAPVERGEANAERLGGLRACVRESFNAVSELKLDDNMRGRRRGGVTVLRGGLPPLSARRHSLHHTAMVRLVCTEVHLCLAIHVVSGCCRLTANDTAMRRFSMEYDERVHTYAWRREDG